MSGEAFIAALRRLDKEIAITLVEDQLVGGECSYWACIPSKTLLRPVEIAFRARSAHGVEATIDPEQVFWWRDQTAGKDDSSQVKWVEGLDAEIVRGRGVATEPGRIEVDGRELSYDELMVSTGSLPQMPPIDGLELGLALDEPRGDERERGAGKPRRRRRRRRGLRARAVLLPPGQRGDHRPEQRLHPPSHWTATRASCSAGSSKRRGSTSASTGARKGSKAVRAATGSSSRAAGRWSPPTS